MDTMSVQQGEGQANFRIRTQLLLNQKILAHVMMQRPSYEPPPMSPTSADCYRRRMSQPLPRKLYSRTPLLPASN